MKFILYSILIFLLVSSCGTLKNPPALTKSNIEQSLRNPANTPLNLIPKTYYGCESVPAKNFIQKQMVGFEFTGKSCHVTVSAGNHVFISFLNKTVAVQALPGTDICIGELGNNQVLVVQHDGAGTLYSATHTIYDSNQHLVYGLSGKGDYIKECMFHLQNTQRLKACE